MSGGGGAWYSGDNGSFSFSDGAAGATGSAYGYNTALATDGFLSAVSQSNSSVGFTTTLNWGQIGSQTLGGALTGGVAGGVGGAIFGPGVLVGAGSGAVVGGIAGGLMEIWNEETHH